MKIMANSIPKGGTHLLLRLIGLLGFESHKFWIGADLIRGRFALLNKLARGHYAEDTVLIGSEVPIKIGARWLAGRLDAVPDNAVFGAHCQYTSGLQQLLEQANVKTICIVRDPRAIAASHLHYIKSSPGHFFHGDYMRLESDHSRLMTSIQGGQLGSYQLESIGSRYRNYVDWSRKGGALIVRFEDLVGEQGGGTGDGQLRAVASVAEFLGKGLPESKIKAVCDQLFGGSFTFRKGQVDSWRDELEQDHKQALSKDLGSLLQDLGYEKNQDWAQ